MIQWTTPTIKFMFSTIDPQDIVSAYLSIYQELLLVIEKPLEDADIGEDYLAWTLTQTESSKLAPGIEARVYCDWKTSGGVRGRSEIAKDQVEESGHNEVM